MGPISDYTSEHIIIEHEKVNGEFKDVLELTLEDILKLNYKVIDDFDINTLTSPVIFKRSWTYNGISRVSEGSCGNAKTGYGSSITYTPDILTPNSSLNKYSKRGDISDNSGWTSKEKPYMN